VGAVLAWLFAVEAYASCTEPRARPVALTAMHQATANLLATRNAKDWAPLMETVSGSQFPDVSTTFYAQGFLQNAKEWLRGMLTTTTSYIRKTTGTASPGSFSCVYGARILLEHRVRQGGMASRHQS
jgi:hypothetical protein